MPAAVGPRAGIRRNPASRTGAQCATGSESHCRLCPLCSNDDDGGASARRPRAAPGSPLNAGRQHQVTDAPSRGLRDGIPIGTGPSTPGLASRVPIGTQIVRRLEFHCILTAPGARFQLELTMAAKAPGSASGYNAGQSPRRNQWPALDSRNKSQARWARLMAAPARPA